MKILLLSIRSLTRFRLYSAINIAGLALSLTCVIILSRYIWQEVSTDRFIQKLDRLYITTVQFKDNPRVRFAGCDDPSKATTFKSPITDQAVEKYSFFIPLINNQVTYNDKLYNADYFVVDSCFLELLDYPLLVGNRNTLLRNPEGAVISQRFARKLFGHDNPVGKRILLPIGKEFIIEGILGEPSTKSSFHFDLLVSLGDTYRWSHLPQLITLFRPDAQVEEANKRLSEFKEIKSWRGEVRYQFFPMKELYFNKQVDQFELYSPGNYTNIRILSVVTLLILLVGLFNFINIYTVLTLKRGREFGMKKVFGAGKWQLFGQLYIENICLTGLAILTGWVCIELTAGIVEHHFNITQQAGIRFDALFSLGLLLLLPLVATLFPFLKYNYARPVTSLRSVNAGGYSTVSRNLFLVIQYIISISLIILSLFFIRQLRFMLDADPGYRTKDIVKIQFMGFDYSPTESEEAANTRKEHFDQQQEAIARQMNESPLFTQWLYGESPYEYEDGLIRFKREGGEFQSVCIDYSSNQKAFDLYQLELLEGRGWNDSIDGWGQYRIIINETAKKLFGIRDMKTDLLQPESRLWFSLDMDMSSNPPYEVIGVVKDFQVGHLSKAVPPVFFCYGVDKGRDSKMQAHCAPGKRAEALLFLKQLNQEIAGGEFKYTFVEDEIKQLYEEDKKVTIIYSVFALIAILISSLGLFSLSLFDVQQRFREIAIRKVNGATTGIIMQLLLRKYIRLLGIAFLLASPIAYLAIHQYLEGFAHKATVAWWLFATALLITAAISFTTLVWQIRRAAGMNPVKAIKSE